jgi:hypothetical protein
VDNIRGPSVGTRQHLRYGSCEIWSNDPSRKRFASA